MWWLQWTLVNALALGLGMAVLRAVVPGFNGDELLAVAAGAVGRVIAVVALTGVSVAVVQGLAQGLVVRRVGVAGGRWATRTVIGLLVGWPLALVVAVPVGLALGPWQAAQGPVVQAVVRYAIAALVGGILGLTLGALQAPLLGGRSGQGSGRRWPLVSALGGAVSFVVLLALLPPFDRWAGPLASFLLGVTSGAAGSAVTGYGLKRFRQNEQNLQNGIGYGTGG